MFILEMEMYYKSSREMQLLREFSLTKPFYSIPNDIRKSSVAIFLGEVLSSVLGEETPNEEMFDFIERSIVWFDSAESGFSNFHLSFLTRLTSFLGIEPSLPQITGKYFFDLRNGRFHAVPPFHGDYAGDTSSYFISLLLGCSIEESGNLSLTGKQRNEILEILIKYYSFHLPSLKSINSLEVMKDIFN
jgi:DNA repair protein RecO (recombination protein O)